MIQPGLIGSHRGLKKLPFPVFIKFTVIFRKILFISLIIRCILLVLFGIIEFTKLIPEIGFISTVQTGA